MNVEVKKRRNAGSSPTPSQPRDLELEHRLPSLLVGRGPAQPTVGVRAEQYQVADPLGMARRVADGDRSALRDTEQREALQAEIVDHGFEVLHEGVDGEVVDVVRRTARSPARRSG